MVRSGDLYSTFVVWLKVILPTFALALLSTLFLFSGKVDVTKSLPYATLNVEEIVREQRISRPYFDGVTASGTEVTLTAAFAKPNPDDKNEFATEDLLIRLRVPGRGALKLTSGFGVVNETTADLSGGVTVITSDGMTIKAPEVAADFEAQTFNTDAGITAISEIGTLTADHMTMSQTDDGLEIHFTGRVRLLYQP